MRPRRKERTIVSGFVIVALLTAALVVFRAFTVKEREAAQEEKKNINIVTIEKGTIAAGRAEPGTFIVSSEMEWQNLWEGIRGSGNATGPRVKTPSLPHVDFSKHTIIAVFHGAAPSGGYSTSIEKVRDGGKTMEISVKERVPDGTCPVLAAITYPYHIIRVAKFSKPIEFKTTTEQAGC